MTKKIENLIAECDILIGQISQIKMDLESKL